MSGATGAEAKRSGTTDKDGARGSAADAQDSESGSQGGTVTDTRDADTAGGALPGERKTQQQASQPYHPPQAYQQGAGGGSGAPAGAGAVRKPRTGARTVPRTRKARLRVARADPWSVMKVSFLLSIALGICTIVAAAVLWMVMDAMGVFSTVGGTISEATGSNESNGFDLQSFLSLPRVLTFTAIIAVIDVVLATALATLGAFIYNLSAGFVGGVELTLAEDE
ncbi:DUF3566 domain-containing protein [Streptomyces sp. BG9H]|uniref:DUF3566 domain-containing protein n=1 Tax=Streptomyces anatolicus TaxID=2675858 RepID=A0ABS6YI39_9ACTN|nr:DUF3566 domain-containing protein [Streptomyces anatolicus]MBW5421067.1 DUF3566 domain-containing protein [Streptomyces anatolicus]